MKAIDKVIDLLPVPVLVAVAALVLGAWLIKDQRALANYSLVYADRYFQALTVVAVAGLCVYYALQFIFTKEAPFENTVRGVVVSRFHSDDGNLVQEQTVEFLKQKVTQESGLGDVRIKSIAKEVPEEDVQKVLTETNAVGVIAGSLISLKSATSVWYRVAWRGENQIYRTQIPAFPDIAEFVGPFLTRLGSATSPVKVADAAAATIEALKHENETLRAELLKGTVAPKTAVASFSSTPRYVLAVGNSNYQHVPRLLFAAKDAKAFVQTLLAATGIPTDRVTVLLDATRLSILEALEEIRNKSSPDTVLYFYFAGHSYANNGIEYLLPVDGQPDNLDSNLSLDEVLRNFARAPSQQVFAFLDCDVGSFNASDTNIRGNLALISAGHSGQPAIEDVSIGHGLFTYYLLRGLSGEADTKRTGLISISELQQYLSAEITKASRGQSQPWTIVSGINATVAIAGKGMNDRI